MCRCYQEFTAFVLERAVVEGALAAFLVFRAEIAAKCMAFVLHLKTLVDDSRFAEGIVRGDVTVELGDFELALARESKSSSIASRLSNQHGKKENQFDSFDCSKVFKNKFE